ncbi:FadR family transcriptional regulator [Candidimonas sp. SYP-B2681]|uniref:FadR/GntR family transcriptional regulator n=1 Tax=Candidimonas sp. SYP-B2681 TaxID=2497686 RepID=UPI000F883CA3|nr:FadR/GntR family transcriptional regulator [Candidimonas sp. SYP-B2681]RTZ47462.1 FadR family transcriptional regulator [Candidimonas sp. SYP-B2681]
MTGATTILRAQDEAKQGYEKVFLFLREKLLGGSLRPGDLLLPERELAEHLDVSRPVVREALRALAMMGVVDIRERVGTFVKKPDASVLGDIFAFTLAQDGGLIEDIMQARIAIECQAIRLACQRITPQDLEDISRALQLIKTTIDSPQDGGMADFEFHSAIVRASKSETLISMYKAMHPLFIRLHKERREVVDVDPDLKAQIIEDHRKIFRALAEKDEQGADEQLRIHFQIGDERRYKATFKTALI